MIIDSHCHMHDPAFADLRATLSSALIQHVWGVIAVGCDADTNAATLRAAAAAPKSVWPCLGFHPDWALLTDEDLDRVEQQIREHQAHIVGVGEVGLPWYSLIGAPDAAERILAGRRRLGRLLKIADRWDLPVVLHAPHGVAAPAFEALRAQHVERAVFHWHKAPPDITRAIVAAGYFVSVGPEVVYRERDRELVELVPLDSLLVESDGPWAYRGEFEGLPSGPWFAARVAEEVAKIKKLPVDDVTFALSANASRLFDLV